MSLNHSVLEVSHLSAGYLHNNHAHFLISDLSFSLRRGEVLALVGASGSGKSMTCSALLDVLPPGVQKTQGTILLDGQPVTGQALRGRKWRRLCRTRAVHLTRCGPCISILPKH